MPRVGSRYFGYDKKGVTAAKKYAKKKGLKLRMHTSKKMRGMSY